jgi:hypothetical protein
VLKPLPLAAARTAVARSTAHGRRQTQLLPLVVTVLLGLFVGHAVAAGDPAFAIAPIAALAVPILATRPWLPFLVVFAAISTVAEAYAYPQFTFGGVNPFLSELLLGLALAAGVLLLPRVRSWSTDEPRTIGFALAAFLVAAMMGAGVARSAGIPAISVLNDLREVAFFSTFWLALVALRRPESRTRVFAFATGFALLVVVLQFAQLIVGTDHILFYTQNYATSLITCPTGECTNVSSSSFLRIRPPGLQTVYIVAAFSACYCLFGPRRRRALALVVFSACLASIVVSLNRNLIGGLALGLAAAVIASPRKSRLLGALVAAIALILALVLVSQTGALRPAAPVLSRFATLGKPAELAGEGSLQQRSNENQLALRAIRHHPLEGIGWGVPYGRTVQVIKNGRRVRTNEQLFIHNLYLGLWMRTGILGLLAYIAAVGAALVYGIRWCRRRRSDEMTWIGAGVVASVVAVSVTAAVAVGTDPEAVVPFMAVLALAVTLARELRANAAVAGGTVGSIER